MERKDLKQKPVPTYISRLKTERANDIYARIVKKLTSEKLYRDPAYTAAKLAADLGTNTRYISAAIAICTGNNYSALVNNLRLHDACKMLRSVSCKELTSEEIGLFAGFSSRQAFYLAFKRKYNCTPRNYRLGVNGE